jgi:hypothetical protein
MMRLGNKNLFLITVSLAVLMIPVIYLIGHQARYSAADPTQVLNRYLKAVYARDFKEAYRFISAQDRRLKEEKTYVREKGAFTGFTLELAKNLAGSIETTPVERKSIGRHALIKLRLKLPDANKLSALLLDWDEDRLNSLPLTERNALIQNLNRLHTEGKLPTIEGVQDFELIKEARGWRVYLSWAAGVRVAFNFSVPPSVPLQIVPTQKEVLTPTGELFTVRFRAKNPSSREVPVRIAHHIEPKAMRDYLELVECGLISPLKLYPGEEEEYFSTYIVRGDLPEGLRQFAVTYEFKLEKF